MPQSSMYLGKIVKDGWFSLNQMLHRHIRKPIPATKFRSRNEEGTLQFPYCSLFICSRHVWTTEASSILMPEGNRGKRILSVSDIHLSESKMIHLETYLWLFHPHTKHLPANYLPTLENYLGFREGNTSMTYKWGEKNYAAGNCCCGLSLSCCCERNLS